MTEYQELVKILRIWRFAPLGDLRLQGEEGRQLTARMHKLKEKLGPESWTAASKEVGWGE